MKRLIWLPVAGFLLVAGAAVAAAAPGVVETAGSLLAGDAGVSASSSPSPGSSGEVERAERGMFVAGASLLDEVLAELVDSGVITQEQSDAFTQALTDRAEEHRAELEARREQLRQMWKQIRAFLEDGVITEDEIAQLPADNPFSNLEEILADGQITSEELESVGPFGGFFNSPREFHVGAGGSGEPGGPGHGHDWFFAEPDDDDSGSDSESSTNS